MAWQSGGMRRPGPLATCLSLAALAGAASARWLGPPADFDLRNYHIYDGMAVLHGRIGIDIAPAQLQSFYAPALDALYALLLGGLNRHPLLLGAALALQQGLAAFLVFRLAARMLPDGPARGAIAAAAALAGVTGAAGASTLGGPMSEMLPACCLLGALLAFARPAWSGVLAGVAIGLKLTFAPFAVGLALAARLAPRFVAGAAAGAALAAGWWWAWLGYRYGNPIFPYFNDLIGSPWGARLSGIDTRFFPHGLAETLFYPLFWSFRASRLASEAPARDPRVLIGWIAALWLIARRPGPRLRPMLWVWGVGYVLWEAVFSILRYLLTLELLAPVLVAASFAPLLARARPRVAVALSWALALAVIAATIPPDWGHAPPGSRAVAVRAPDFSPGTLVVLLDWSPMSYVAAFAPRSVQFVGGENNLVVAGAPDLLSRAVAAAIAGQRGPIWGLARDAVVADRALRAYGLARAGTCVRVRSNLDRDAIRACPLRRIAAGR
ncbi:MAG: hypothetical protein KGI51_09260 [Rhodospirillales bacterium]|nr:hypothetical protein [Rhodospirillales bacterium]